MKTKAFVADWKRKEVSEIQDFVQSSDVVGLVDVTGIGAKQMLTMRSSLRDVGVRLRMSRNRLLKLALAGASKNKKGVEQIVDVFAPRQIALLSSTASPFKVFQMLMESQTQAPAKGGETASYDIIIEKGPTPFPAGPIVGDFQNAGFPAAIEKGKIVIIYSQKSDEREYLRYAKYLQAKSYLGDELELLELEDVQGVIGLKAIRVNILYTSEHKEHEKPITYENLMEELH